MTEHSSKNKKSLGKTIISLSIIGSFSVIGIGVLSLNTLMNPKDLNSAKNTLNEAIVPENSSELISSEISKDTKKISLSFLTLIFLLLACSGGSLFITYILRLLVTSKKPVTTQKISPTVSRNNNFEDPITPTISVIPPQESTPVDRQNSSLAEIMDIRKRRSLVSIMHDN